MNITHSANLPNMEKIHVEEYESNLLAEKTGRKIKFDLPYWGFGQRGINACMPAE